jgi:hypothetical protein
MSLTTGELAYYLGVTGLIARVTEEDDMLVVHFYKSNLYARALGILTSHPNFAYICNGVQGIDAYFNTRKES